MRVRQWEDPATTQCRKYPPNLKNGQAQPFLGANQTLSCQIMTKKRIFVAIFSNFQIIEVNYRIITSAYPLVYLSLRRPDKLSINLSAPRTCIQPYFHARVMKAKNIMRAGIDAFNSGRYAAAVQAFSEAERRSVSGADMMLGHALWSAGRRKESIAKFRRAAKRRPDDAGIRKALDDALRAMKRSEGAAVVNAQRNEDPPQVGALNAAPTARIRSKKSAFLRIQGDAWLNADEPKRAIASFRGALALQPRDPWTLGKIAHALNRVGKHAAAEAAFKRAAALGDRESSLCLAKKWLARGPDPRARRLLKNVAAPGGGPDRNRLAAFLLLNRCVEAEKEGVLLLSSENDADIHGFLLNPLLVGRGVTVPHDLLDHLRKAERDRPNDPWPTLFRLSILSYQKRKIEAVPVAEELRRRARGRDAWMRYQCGHLSLQTFDEVHAAEADFKAALGATPTLWRARAYLAEISLIRGNHRQAFRWMDELVDKSSGISLQNILAWRGLLYLWIGRYSTALKDLDRAVSGGAQFARTWRAGALVKLGRARDALPDLDLVLSPGNSEEEARLWRAEANLMLGDIRGALTDLNTLLNSDPSSYWGRILRGLAHLRRGAAASARADLVHLTFSDGRTLSNILNNPGAVTARLERELAVSRGVRRSDRYLMRLYKVSSPKMKARGRTARN